MRLYIIFHHTHRMGTRFNDYERPSRSSFLNEETREHGFLNNNYKRNIFSTNEWVRLIRNLENICNRCDLNSFRRILYQNCSLSIPPDMRLYIMKRPETVTIIIVTLIEGDKEMTFQGIIVGKDNHADYSAV